MYPSFHYFIFLFITHPSIIHPSIDPSIIYSSIFLSTIHPSILCISLNYPSTHPLMLLPFYSIQLSVHPLLIHPYIHSSISLSTLHLPSNFQLFINPPTHFYLHPYSMHHPSIINSPCTHHLFIHFSIHWPTHHFQATILSSIIYLLFLPPNTVICVSCCTEPHNRW